MGAGPRAQPHPQLRRKPWGEELAARHAAVLEAGFFWLTLRAAQFLLVLHARPGRPALPHLAACSPAVSDPRGRRGQAL